MTTYLTRPLHHTSRYETTMGKQPAIRPDESPSPEDSGAAEIDYAAEKRLVRKLDLYIIPHIMLLYLLSFLDRSDHLWTLLAGSWSLLAVTDWRDVSGLILGTRGCMAWKRTSGSVGTSIRSPSLFFS